MAWQDVLIPLVRNLIGDVSDDPTYDDDRIIQAIITAGLIVSQEYDFGNDYTFDFISSEIDPDPTSEATLETTFVALVGLKAACILSLNTYQGAVATGIRVRDGDSEVDTTSGFKGYSDIIANGPCLAYKNLLAHLSRQQGMNRGLAVMSPYTGSDSAWGVRSHNGVWHIRSFYDSFLLW